MKNIPFIFRDHLRVIVPKNAGYHNTTFCDVIFDTLRLPFINYHVLKLDAEGFVDDLTQNEIRVHTQHDVRRSTYTVFVVLQVHRARTELHRVLLHFVLVERQKDLFAAVEKFFHVPVNAIEQTYHERMAFVTQERVQIQ